MSRIVSEKKRVLWSGLILSFIAFMHATAFAGTLTLVWDPPTTNTDGTPLADLAGYKIYYGTTSGSYTNTIDVGNVDSSVVNNLADGFTYYCAVTAYDSAGVESGYSNEVSKTTPAPQFTVKTVMIPFEHGGTITPAVATSVNSGANQTITMVPNAGYRVLMVFIDGIAVGAVTTYTLSNITANHTIVAIFVSNTYTLNAEAGTGGEISPSGYLSANYGGNATFSITPNAGYTITDVKVDGISNGALTTYTFANIAASHNITATFGALPVSPGLTCSDPGIPCVERTDGLPDGNNLVDNKPKVDVEFEFRTMVIDPGGAPHYVRFFMAQRNAPVPGDFFGNIMNCGGNFGTGAICTYRTELGPAANHKFYIEAKLSDGSLVFYPQAGYIDGPQIEMLNGVNFVGAPRDLRGVFLDGIDAFGADFTFRRVPGGTPTNSDDGHFEAVNAANHPVKPGEGYLVWGSSNPSLPDLDIYPNLLEETLTVPLQPGWNIISNPYDGNVKLADIQVQQGTNDAVSWLDAASYNWLSNAVYYYNGSDWGYTYSIESAGGTTDAILVPWRAYWVYLNESDAAYSLVISKP